MFPQRGLQLKIFSFLIFDSYPLISKQLDVNIWIIKCKTGYIAFDSGYVNFKDAKKDFDKLSINPDDIKHVFITHADMDHAGGLVSDDVMCKNAKVYIHKNEEKMLLGIEKRFKFGLIQFANPIKYKGEYTTLEDREKIEICGSVVETFALPGHTPGHSGYLVDNEIFISGDSMAFNEEGGYCFFPIFNMNTKVNIKSLQNLKEKFKGNFPKYFLTGHSGVYQGRNPFLHIEKKAKGTKKTPFSKTAPYDVFK